MIILVSSAEPKEFWSLGKNTNLPERYGADFMFGSKLGLVGIQRKQFPSDFLSSLRGDDRMSRELFLMKRLKLGIWILEGHGNWTSEGFLIYGGRFKYYQNELWGWIATVQGYLGYPVFITSNSAETYRLVNYLRNWANKDDHGSLFERNKIKGSDWPSHFMQGIEGIGRRSADKFIAHYGGLPVVLQPGVTDDLEKVMGPHKAALIRNALKGVDE